LKLGRFVAVAVAVAAVVVGEATTKTTKVEAVVVAEAVAGRKFLTPVVVAVAVAAVATRIALELTAAICSLRLVAEDDYVAVAVAAAAAVHSGVSDWRWLSPPMYHFRNFPFSSPPPPSPFQLPLLLLSFFCSSS